MSSRTRSDFGTLGERTDAAPGGAVSDPAASNRVPAEPVPQPTTPEASRVQVVDARHVWVDGHHAGLLLAWRRLGVWQGRVFWCPPDAPEPALDWIDQERLQPRDPR